MVLPPLVPKAQIKFEIHKINLKYASLMLVVNFPCNSYYVCVCNFLKMNIKYKQKALVLQHQYK